ncbi:hypothetical protein [Sphingomonas sp.]|uniref:hypothetical protein n=1 Tax=Sphingomonas sp. TaxID=28214 RepID=UPI003CC65D47
MRGDSSGGVGCLGVVAIVLIVLKLAGLIAWSWWLVLLPIWAALAIGAAAAVLTIVFVAVSVDRKGT